MIIKLIETIQGLMDPFWQYTEERPDGTFMINTNMPLSERQIDAIRDKLIKDMEDGF